jgi:hypothetical protein
LPVFRTGREKNFPSSGLGYATWEWIKLDSGKANLANETLSALCEFVGCCVDAGPHHSPDERHYIERFFGTVHTRLSSRLPGYNGSHLRDLRRALSDPKSGLRLWCGSVKAKATKIKLINKDIDYAHWIVVGHIVLKILGQQNSLITVFAFDESLHVPAPT